MTIDILCKVIDNYGDIGFVYRLARSLRDIDSSLSLRIIVDDIFSFSKVFPKINVEQGFQKIQDYTIIPWDKPSDQVLEEYSKTGVLYIIETYSCGRPSWLNSHLFSKSNTKACKIVNIEYLTCESWAQDFHLLPSYTQSTHVTKIQYQPGFVKGMGGLVVDKHFCFLLEKASTLEGVRFLKDQVLSNLNNEQCTILQSDTRTHVSFNEDFKIEGREPRWFVIFTYEQDFEALIIDLALFAQIEPCIAFVAAGRGGESFIRAWDTHDKPFPIVVLPFLAQEDWDTLLLASDFLFVRGEESFSRAVLSGKPFIWHCYPFYDELTTTMTGHFPKVGAFLDWIKAYCSVDFFKIYDAYIRGFNGQRVLEKGELYSILEKVFLEGSDVLPFLKSAEDALSLGNCAEKVMGIFN